MTSSVVWIVVVVDPLGPRIVGVTISQRTVAAIPRSIRVVVGHTTVEPFTIGACLLVVESDPTSALLRAAAQSSRNHLFVR
jgi:hypothetical protein